ncbi:permease [Paenibacillus sp. H1-7]|uniref:permease n=1 Tax=Paenibacillus sp. H1-7 TaxID=2282849 RepID=UPI001EF9B0BB|nr:permease [Paenibacillus sp. H1-7]ULL13506.1 permease [Paenibacillus sp. H1-7]
MFAGHFGLAATVKAKTPEVPLWAIMLGTQLLDVAFVPLFLSGVETIEPVEGSQGYGGSVIHADYTHSLVGALLITLLAGLLASRFWGKRSGFVIGSVVFSHWLLDLIVHRMDLPLLPGNLGNLPLLGFGLWQFPGVSMVLELVLVGAGFLLYARSLLKNTHGKTKSWALTASGAMGVLLLLSLLTDVFGVG